MNDDQDTVDVDLLEPVFGCLSWVVGLFAFIIVVGIVVGYIWELIQ